MIDFPERIYVVPKGSLGEIWTISVNQETEEQSVEYVRADIHQAEIDALHTELDRLVQMMEFDARMSE